MSVTLKVIWDRAELGGTSAPELSRVDEMENGGGGGGDGTPSPSAPTVRTSTRGVALPQLYQIAPHKVEHPRELPNPFPFPFALGSPFACVCCVSCTIAMDPRASSCARKHPAPGGVADGFARSGFATARVDGSAWRDETDGGRR